MSSNPVCIVCTLLMLVVISGCATSGTQNAASTFSMSADQAPQEAKKAARVAVNPRWLAGDEARRAELDPLHDKPAPALVVERWAQTPHSGAMSLEQLKGKVVLIDFWAQWCGPCMAAIPKINQLQEEFKDDLVIIGVSETIRSEGIERYATSKNMKIAICADTNDQTKAAYRQKHLPEYYIIDRAGILRAASVRPEALHAAVTAYVNEPVEHAAR